MLWFLLGKDTLWSGKDNTHSLYLVMWVGEWVDTCNSKHMIPSGVHAYVVEYNFVCVMWCTRLLNLLFFSHFTLFVSIKVSNNSSWTLLYCIPLKCHKSGNFPQRKFKLVQSYWNDWKLLAQNLILIAWRLILWWVIDTYLLTFLPFFPAFSQIQIFMVSSFSCSLQL